MSIAWLMQNISPHQYQILRRTNTQFISPHQYQNRVYAPGRHWKCGKKMLYRTFSPHCSVFSELWLNLKCFKYKITLITYINHKWKIYILRTSAVEGKLMKEQYLLFLHRYKPRWNQPPIVISVSFLLFLSPFLLFPFYLSFFLKIWFYCLRLYNPTNQNQGMGQTVPCTKYLAHGNELGGGSLKKYLR